MATLGDSTITNLNVLNNITGKGSGITNLNASNLSSGSIGNITYEGKLSTASKIVVTDSNKLITVGSIDPANLVLTTDSRLSDARTPTSHAHGNITNAGKVTTEESTAANISKLLIVNSDGTIKTATKANALPTISVSSSDGVSITPAGGGTATTYKYTHPSAETTAPGVYKIGRDSQGHVVIGDAITSEDIGSNIEIVDLTTLA